MKHDPNGSSVETTFDFKEGKTYIVTYDSNGQVIDKQETWRSAGRRLVSSPDDFEYDATFAYNETPLDYGVPFFEHSYDSPFTWVDLDTDTTLTFCSFELVERFATVQKVIQDLNGANREAWDGL